MTRNELARHHWEQRWKDLTGIAWPIYEEHVLVPERRQRKKVALMMSYVQHVYGRVRDVAPT
ncbi:MAG: hypothetical protein KF809_17400 [Chloroflexi bacterium]|nr:hypothetical protein [Chloroflexota bacterium]